MTADDEVERAWKEEFLPSLLSQDVLGTEENREDPLNIRPLEPSTQPGFFHSKPEQAMTNHEVGDATLGHIYS